MALAYTHRSLYVSTYSLGVLLIFYTIFDGLVGGLSCFPACCPFRRPASPRRSRPFWTARWKRSTAWATCFPGIYIASHPRERIDEAVKSDVISQEEGRKLHEVFDLVHEVIKVDDFAQEDLARKPGTRASGSRKYAGSHKSASNRKKKKTRVA